MRKVIFLVLFLSSIFVFGQKDSTFILKIDYSRTLEEMIFAGKFSWSHYDINAKNFPPPVELLGKVVENECKIFCFNKDYISSKTVIVRMEAKGFRPANLAELLALAEAKPELQRQHPIAALGSAYRFFSGDRGVPCLRVDDSNRKLDLGWFGDGWSANYCFLAVRK
jgi:hypothetical protein